MIEVPYYTPGVGFDESAHRAAKKRAIYYGSAGFLDPRTWTLDPGLFYFYRRRLYTTIPRRIILKSAFAGSIRMAAWTSVSVATAAYLGADPLNVTPGYGHTPEQGGVTVDGELHSLGEYFALGLDPRHYYM